MQSIEAKALSLALEVGVVSVGDVHAWADRRIRSAEKPDFKLIELSTEPDSAGCLSLLHELAADGDKAIVATLALRHLAIAYAAKRVSPRTAATMVSRLLDEGYIPDDDAARQMAWFTEDLALIDVKEYSPELESRILGDFTVFLARFNYAS
ncbi:hypothetical protein OOT46_24370 [Aquabacterium sp. A7-Y]|uniref:hypothetical protein n=1 Tax=Aquabacterium sp. A7-Y TaxID=1349605 RepID=UPI00223E423B|nr:hypothetical protein [Aquabacterium sp. A7-Y]MCW7540961.1 hypothetical protein [Aquabacterium sp. A7-Y]